METVPLTAWEQSVIVVMFAVFMGSLLTTVFLFVRWILCWAADRDEKWQGFMTGLRDQGVVARSEDVARSERRHGEMASAVGEMARAITTLTQRFDGHVIEEETRFNSLTDALFAAQGKRKER